MGIKRYELSEAKWQKIAPMLPGKAGDPGRTAGDNRLFVNGALWVLQSGVRWSDLPGVMASIRRRTSASPAGRGPVCGRASSPCSLVTATTSI